MTNTQNLTTAAQDIADAMVAIFPTKSLGEISDLVVMDLSDRFDSTEFEFGEFDRVADAAAAAAIEAL